MNFDIIPTSGFARALKALAKKYRSIKHDIDDFSKSLQENHYKEMNYIRVFEKYAWLYLQKGEENPEVQEL